MERLTDKHFNKSLGYYMKCSGCCERSIACNECEEFEALVDRIGAIEEILGDDYDLDYLRNLANQRMTMREDVAERMKLVGGIPIERLRELVEADRDGRCVVLPCKVGDPVFMGTGRSKITGYEEDICDGFYIGRNGVLQVKVQNYKGNHGTYGVIGQTAELTSEAAEAAMKGEQEGEKDGNMV